MGSLSISDITVAADQISPFLLDMAVRSLIVMVVPVLTVLAMRRASAATRHSMWLAGFAGLLILPALTLLLPGWRILPRLGLAEPATVGFNAQPTPAPSVMPAESQSASVLRDISPVDQNTKPGAPSAALSEGGGPRSAGEPVSGARGAAIPIPTPAVWLAAIWFAGMIIVLAPVLLGHASLMLLQRRSQPVGDSEWCNLFNRLCCDLGISRPVALFSTPLRTMPMTWGIRQARVLLPASANSWPQEQRRSVLLHELAHVRRRDCLTQLLAQVGCALYWFNPLVWVAWNRMQVERERACDDLVLNAGAKASMYAEHLLHSASSMVPCRFVGAAALAMARASTLEARLRNILDPQQNRRSISIRSAVLTTMVLLAGLIPVAAIRAQDATPGPAPSRPATTLPSGQETPTNATVEQRMQIRRDQIDPETVVTGTSSTISPSARGSVSGRGARGGGRSSGRGSNFELSAGVGATCSLDATIYDVRIPVQQIGRLDMNLLKSKSGTPEEFEQALAALGTSQPLYRANQSVRLVRDSITVGANVPYVANASTTARGQAVRTHAYTQVGAMFNLLGKTQFNGTIELDMSIELSSIVEGTTEIADGEKAAVFRTSTMSYKGIVQPNQPFVLMSIDAGSVDTNGKAMAYIARITLGTPQTSEPTPARGE